MGHPIIVTVSGETVDEIRSKLIQLAKQFGHDDGQESPAVVDMKTSGRGAVHANVPVESEPTPAEKPRRGRPPSAEKSPTSAEKQSGSPLKETVGESGPGTSPVSATKDHVLAALQRLQSAVNLKAVIDVLGKFSAKKASEVKESDYAAVVAECNRQVAASPTLTA